MDDWTWYDAEATYWSCIESNVAIMCGSVPTLKPLIVRIYPRFGIVQEYSNFDTSQERCTNKLGLNTSRQPVDVRGHLNTTKSSWELQYIPGSSNSHSPSTNASTASGANGAEVTTYLR